MDEEKITIEGVVENIIFSNEENGYTVCEIISENELFTIVGTMPFLVAGETVKAQGTWSLHPSFGRQFKVECFEKALPADQEAIYKYLSSGSIKGIGPVTAQRIVDRFGEDTFDVLEKNPEWLSEIRGITKKNAEKIAESFASQFGVRSVMLFLNKFFGASISVKIYKKYKSAAIDIVKSNPYRLCSEISGIGFEKADRVAKELGFSNDCDERLESGIKYVLMNSAYQNGHSYLPYSIFISESQKVLSADISAIDNMISFCVQKGEIVRHEYDGHEGYSLLRLFGAESYIAQKLKQLNSNDLPFRLDGIDTQIDILEKSQDIIYHEKQRKAIKFASCYGISVVTGGPGTGKTTVIKAILNIYDTLGISYMLAAPTGRAAKRMNESSGREAKTIHRLLEMVYSDDGIPVFSRNADNPLGCKAIIIDEMSMVDIFLMEALLRAIKPDSILVLIGDADQLPSVGPGNILSDMIACDIFPVTRLEHIFRQASESLIIMNAHRINNGEQPVLTIKNSDFFFMERQNPLDARDLIASLCRDRLPKTYGIDSFEDIQVISPTRRGELGTYELNKVLQEFINPKDKHIKEKRVRDVFFRENDKVMQTKNNYDLTWTRDGEDGKGIFNGDIGKITEIRFRDECFVINFDGRICEYDFALSDDLEHAYAVTVHKCQGSEYPYVILPVLRCPIPLMTRNLLYTAVTRARKMLILVGSRDVINRMVLNNKKDVRFTSLIFLF